MSSFFNYLSQFPKLEKQIFNYGKKTLFGKRYNLLVGFYPVYS